MYQTVSFWRVVSFNKAQGPWRATREQARRDAIALGLGNYDEHGSYFHVVPGDVQMLTIETRILREALEPALGPDVVIVDRSMLKRPRRQNSKRGQQSTAPCRQSKMALPR